MTWTISFNQERLSSVHHLWVPSYTWTMFIRFSTPSELFNLEAAMYPKKAHRLGPTVVDPKSIERVSVKLATAVFNESTRDALEFYEVDKNKPTAAFIKLIIRLWNVRNVKTRTKRKHKRDYTMDPVRSSNDWKLAILREFAEFLTRWETAKTLQHTCLALTDFCIISSWSSSCFSAICSQLLLRLVTSTISGDNYYVLYINNETGAGTWAEDSSTIFIVINFID